MSTELSKVKADRAQAEARLAALEHGGVSGAAGAGVDTESLDQLKQLRVMEAEAAQALASLGKDLGPRHPKYVAAQASLAQVRARIAEEQARVLSAARSEATAARMREESLSADIEKLKNELAQANESEVKLDELQREADASRTLLETFLARSKEQSMQQSFQQPNVKVLATADPPVDPSRPNKAMVMLLSVFAFMVVGVSAAFAREAFDRGLRSGEQIERLTRLPSLGLVPALGGMARPEEYVVRRPGSAFGEAIRNIYAGVVLPEHGEPPKLILVTSSLPREGKTTVVLSLARLLALSGKSVLVVDCDLRRPSVHRALGRPQDPGLVDLLFRREPLERVIQQDPASPARFIAAGTAHRNAAALLGSPELPELLRDLRGMFDVVLIDSAPVLAVSDPRVLSVMVDKTVFLVRWGHGDRGTVSEALKRLAAAGADMAGVALTRVDLRRNARYGFGDSGYYGRAVRYYYR
ncbi:MAG: AAA family ATPase, partial [Rhodospirillaceae bacterium]|nr:AAA family ATPase [Rhodospirillaceae bacterium]